MKKIYLLALSLISLPVFALDADELLWHTEPGDIYFGVGLTQVQIDNAEQDANNMTAHLGGNVMANKYGRLYIDSSFSRTIIDEAKVGDEEFDMNLITLHLSYRTPTRAYFKAKAGWVYTGTELDSEGNPNVIDSTTRASLGAGLGLEIYDGIDIEVEYMEVQEAANAIQLSIVFN